MKIGIDCRELTQKITGIGRFLLDFLTGVKKYTELEFILFGNEYTNFSQECLSRYKKVVIKEYFTLWYDQIQLYNAIKENKIDLFFSPYYKIPLFTNVPTIISLFDLIYLIDEHYKNKFKNKYYIRNYIKLASRKVEKIITISNSAKNDLKKLLNLSDKKIDVLYLSVSEKFKPQSFQRIEEMKNKYKIKGKYILYVGNANPHKNLNRLISAYEILPENLKKEYYLILAGVGDFVPFVRPSTLYILPYVSEEDLSALYSGAELFVFPSLYEGFGLPPLEAMACACPVISSNTSSMREVLGDGCIYFNPYEIKEMSDKIQYILENKSLKDELKYKCSERVKIFSSEKMVNGLMKIFNSLITNH